MTLNLITSRWLPIKRRSGSSDTIAPYQIVEFADANERDTERYQQQVVALNAPRADFNAALIQFLIGLSQTCLAKVFASTDDQWFAIWDQPPTAEQLQTAFETVAHCFNADGDYPRFMQDESVRQQEGGSIAALLIDSPGENTVRNNADHFIKRGNVNAMSLEMAIMALMTLQINAPSGGQGHRTSLRGGGPLSTIVVGNNLWQTVWLNTLPSQQFISEYSHNGEHLSEGDIFPWMRSTKTSKEKGSETTPLDAHPLCMYWATPRRIHLATEQYSEGHCDISNTPSKQLVTEYATMNYGNNYIGWLHPLSPYNGSMDKERTAEHGQPGGIRYRHWTGFTQNRTSKNKAGDEVIENTPARVVSYFLHERIRYLENIPRQFWVFGYDMDNMKARCWYEGTMPLISIPDENHRQIFEVSAQRHIDCAVEISFYLRAAIREVLRKRSGDVAPDSTPVVAIESQFWSASEEGFYSSLRLLREAILGAEKTDTASEQFLSFLKKAAMDTFESFVSTFPIGESDIQRIAQAENKFNTMLYSNKPRGILHLEVKEKETKKKTTKPKSTSTQKK